MIIQKNDKLLCHIFLGIILDKDLCVLPRHL